MMKRAGVLVAVAAFAAALGVVIGQRLSHEAEVIVLGVVAGLAGSLPTSVFVVWLTRRWDARPGAYQAAPVDPIPAPEPKIIVVQAAPAGAAAAVSGYPAVKRSPREFTVIGGAEIIDE